MVRFYQPGSLAVRHQSSVLVMVTSYASWCWLRIAGMSWESRVIENPYTTPQFLPATCIDFHLQGRRLQTVLVDIPTGFFK